MCVQYLLTVDTAEVQFLQGLYILIKLIKKCE